MKLEVKTQLAQKVREWLDQSSEHSQAELSRKTGLSQTNISHIAGDRWQDRVIGDAQWQTLIVFFAQDLHIDSPNYRNIIAACQKAQRHRDVIAINGYTGAGKSYSLQRYAKDHPGTYYVICDPTMTKRAFLWNLARQVGVQKLSGNQHFLLMDIIQRIERSATDTLIVFDEIEDMPLSAWGLIKTLIDRLQGKAGIIVSGIYRDVLEKMASRAKPGMPQLLRRLGHSWLEMRALRTREVRSFAQENGISDDAVVKALARDCTEYHRLQRYVRDTLHAAHHTKRPITLELYNDLFHEAA